MPIQLTPLRGEEFIKKVLHGDRYFTAVRLEEGFDFTRAEDYSTLRRYLEKNSHRKLDVTDSEFRYIRAPDLMLARTDLRDVRGLEYCYNVESAGFDETIISPRELDILRRLLEKKRFVVRE